MNLLNPSLDRAAASLTLRFFKVSTKFFAYCSVCEEVPRSNVLWGLVDSQRTGSWNNH
jgi:hypothetical protein